MSAGLCFLMFIGFVLFEFGWILDRPLYLLGGLFTLLLLLESCVYLAYETKCQQAYQTSTDVKSVLTLDACYCILPNGEKKLVR